jgi:signal transduction histidine kinase
MTSFLGVPIRTAGESVGNFYLTDKVGAAEFSEQDQRLVEMFALHAGIAIQNARLHARVQRLAVLDERLRIGRDLHDGIIQGIYAVSLSLEDVPELMDEDRAEASSRIDHAIDRLTTTISEIRTFIMGLGSDSGDVPIETALVGLADELLLGSGTRMALDLDLAGAPAVDEHLSPEAASQVLHIAREALSNALRHSDAGRIRVSLIADGDDAVLSVEDDGRGFDPDAPRGPGHFGVANMHDRAATIGGTLQIRSRPGLGTRIIVRLPLSQQEIRPT